MPQLPLSPIDHVFVGPGSYPIEFAFFYPQGLDRARLEGRLADAWLRVAQVCPLLDARLIEMKSCLGFEWGDGAASSSPPIEWVSVPGPVRPEAFAAPYDLINPVTTKPGNPLARLKITRGSDGAVVGFSFSHAIADGFTYFMVLNALARAAREPGSAVAPMDHRRSLLWDLARTAEANGQSGDLVGFCEGSPRMDFDRDSIQYSRRSYSAREIEAMQARYAGAAKRLSTNDIICAELWREFTARSDSGDSKDVSFVAPVDFRRILPDFPKNYAGNAVVLARSDKPRHVLLGEDPRDSASAVHDAIQSARSDYIARSLASLSRRVKADEVGGLGRAHIVDPDSGLLITNLSRMSLAGLDFGSGEPTYCRPLTPCRRLVVLLSDGLGGIHAHIHG